MGVLARALHSTTWPRPFGSSSLPRSPSLKFKWPRRVSRRPKDSTRAGRYENENESPRLRSDGHVDACGPRTKPIADSRIAAASLPRRGSGLVFPTKFAPPSPSLAPTQLFKPYPSTNNSTTRWARIAPNSNLQLLIFADGACLGNGLRDPRAGWAFVTGPLSQAETSPRIISGRLENKGPFGDATSQTSNRAELRAVLAALRSQPWGGIGVDTIVIATDSKLLVEGLTTWVKSWIVRGWKQSERVAVKNRDLWEALLGEVERLYQVDNIKIQFWSIPRRLNEAADAAAKAAAKGNNIRRYTDVFDIWKPATLQSPDTWNDRHSTVYSHTI